MLFFFLLLIKFLFDFFPPFRSFISRLPLLLPLSASRLMRSEPQRNEREHGSGVSWTMSNIGNQVKACAVSFDNKPRVDKSKNHFPGESVLFSPCPPGRSCLVLCPFLIAAQSFGNQRDDIRLHEKKETKANGESSVKSRRKNKTFLGSLFLLSLLILLLLLLLLFRAPARAPRGTRGGPRERCWGASGPAP